MSATGLATGTKQLLGVRRTNGDYEAPPRRRGRQRWPRPINAVRDRSLLSPAVERRDMSSEIESGRQNRNKSKGGDEGEARGGERDFVTVRLEVEAHVRLDRAQYG